MSDRIHPAAVAAGALAGFIVGLIPLMIFLMGGCPEKKAEADIVKMGVGFAERLDEIEEEQLAMWEVINDMDPNIPSPTPKYNPCTCDCVDDENNGYELDECLQSCKTDKKHYDITPSMWKECVGKCKNQYGEK